MNNEFKYTYNPLRLTAKAAENASKNLSDILRPSEVISRFDARFEELARAYSLPRIKACVGAATVDMISYEQGLVFINQMNWRPRPVFQSYYACTPWLIAANAQFFQGPRAPEYLIFKFQTIDRRMPTLEDSGALVQVFHHYQPVLVEKGCLL